MKKFISLVHQNDPVSADDQSFLNGNTIFRTKNTKIMSGGCESCDDSGAGCDDCGGPTGG